MRDYRDWFIAHLDDERTMYPPRMRIARQSIAFLYDHLVQIEDTTGALRDVRQSAAQFYAFWRRQGRQAHFEHEARCQRQTAAPDLWSEAEKRYEG